MSRSWALLSFSLAIIVSFSSLIAQTAASEGSGNDSRIRTAVEILLRVPTGRALITKALKSWKLDSPQDLRAVLRPGTASRTDAVLTRHYNPSTGTESREREVTIYVRQEQSLDNIVLDIAHEMVHATSRPGWDPYDPDLTAGRYIKSAIEGEGGEVQAVATECQVALELTHQFGIKTERCHSYFKADTKQIDPERIKADFYRVGKWDGEIAQALGNEKNLFPELSSDSPRLFSSTGNAPYPAALLREFEALTQTACENSKRRLDTVQGRSIASASGASGSDATSRFLERRCQ